MNDSQPSPGMEKVLDDVRKIRDSVSEYFETYAQKGIVDPINFTLQDIVKRNLEFRDIKGDVYDVQNVDFDWFFHGFEHLGTKGMMFDVSNWKVVDLLISLGYNILESARRWHEDYLPEWYVRIPVAAFDSAQAPGSDDTSIAYLGAISYCRYFATPGVAASPSFTWSATHE
jgi:hypothetical protein